MAAERFLIVNADDFGLSSGVNRGIITAHTDGIVTSASLMVRAPAAREAAEYCRSYPSLSLGLHVDLGEWIYQNEDWIPLYHVVPTTDSKAVADEIMRQFDQFVHLTGGNPTHLDSHQHVHRHEPVRSILLSLARNLHVPLRHFSPGIHYCGDFYGQTAKGAPFPEAITVPKLVNTLLTLPSGITELGCHPGHPDDLNSSYRDERYSEVRTLCDPQVRTSITNAQISLCSFGDIACIAAESN